MAADPRQPANRRPPPQRPLVLTGKSAAPRVPARAPPAATRRSCCAPRPERREERVDVGRRARHVRLVPAPQRGLQLA
eukprot:CAMPEP_0183815012 /NCGR_PEP_ID=MMETSP0803_2-20130417/56086_1 /TAXON_ID=195967 /ORGANISM="Crustomastix stigmata, Strain CCMP3273" /LENGTH=77 /DNA_ID=CAMNT_0026059877 /DNA_START=34 /DNA_END=263 /DNA_ORIENTATION=+